MSARVLRRCELVPSGGGHKKGGRLDFPQKFAIASQPVNTCSQFLRGRLSCPAVSSMHFDGPTCIHASLCAGAA